MLPLSPPSLPSPLEDEDDDEESDDPSESPLLFGAASGFTLLGMLCVSALGFLLSPDGFLCPDFSLVLDFLAALPRSLWVESLDFFAASASAFDESEFELELSESLVLSELLSESCPMREDTSWIRKN